MKIFEIRPEDVVFVKEPIIFHLPIGDIPVVQKGFYLKQKRANDLIKFIETKCDKKIVYNISRGKEVSCIDLALKNNTHRFYDIADEVNKVNEYYYNFIYSNLEDVIYIDDNHFIYSDKYFDNYKKFSFIKLFSIVNDSNNNDDRNRILNVSNISSYDLCINYIKMYKYLEDNENVAKYQIFLDYVNNDEYLKNLFKTCTWDLLRNVEVLINN